MSDLNICFSDYLRVYEDNIETYGVINISLINEMLLFTDPFL